jgi:hypothetical protein
MWGAADLDAGMAEIERLFGVAPAPGGSHPGRGTRNALLGLADGHYLEIIAPDPAQRLAGTFGAALADLTQPALVTWALASKRLARISKKLEAAGLRPQGPIRMHRTTPDGVHLEWDLLFAGNHVFGPLFPFFIDWRETPHPSADLPVAGTLEAVTVESPEARALAPLLGALDIPVVVNEASEPLLRATIETVHGRVVLESSAATLGMQFG